MFASKNRKTVVTHLRGIKTKTKQRNKNKNTPLKINKKRTNIVESLWISTR